ncbi:hypothetical protein HUU51_05515 [Candidatus Gracilibacteria bacterium]|nr:hypothetical protein [Candidatus Gracilibacteria bacterium]
MTKKRLKILQRENNKIEILETIQKILNGNFDNLDIIKMRGYEKHYRCRIGKIRIIFYEQNGKYFVDKIGYRGDIYK